MLNDETLVAFLSTANAAAARTFYEGVLGLTFVLDDEHLLVLESGASRVSFQKSKRVNPKSGTALGWNVRDLRGTVKALMARDIVFQRSGMVVDELGIWSPIPGHGVAWFKDPDGHTLSLAGTI